jgi:hypothetical protein
MCLALEQFWLRLINTLVGMWNQFVFVPWTLCSAGPCSWWCICCNKWLCWVALILVAIITILFWIVMAVIVSVITLICESICILGAIGPDKNPRCFGGAAPGPIEPPPPPVFPDPPVPPTKPE